MEIPEKQEKWDLNEILLRALALADSGHPAEAEIEFLKAFDVTGIAFTADKDNWGVAADLYFAYGRLLHEMKRPGEGHPKIKQALGLYTRAYGINDGRTIFCQRKLKELSRANNDSDELFRADLFLKAHHAVQSLIAAAFLYDKGHDRDRLIAAFCERSSLSQAIPSVEQNEASLAALADKQIVDLALELFADSARAEPEKGGLVVFQRKQGENFIQQCLTNPASFVDAFNKAVGENLLLLVKAEAETDSVLDLFLEKAPLAESQRKKSRSKKLGVEQSFKWPCSELDDLALAFNNRLRKLGREGQFYLLRSEADGEAAYLLCTPSQFQTVKACVPLRRLGR
ncbi:MAG: hypothetical protein KGS72_01200 [Cyanobacteria bacterium REEB67]|nr:hypothetical protein [Cyanobacteria bacterium REEB67]